MKHAEYPRPERWDVGKEGAPWRAPMGRNGESVPWYSREEAGKHYPGRPESWTEGRQRDGLIDSILDLQSSRRYSGEQMTRAKLEKWPTATLEYVANTMTFAAAAGLAGLR
jgi:hypothetical protein